MSKVPYLHYPKDKDHLIHAYFWALVPLLFFGFYKNGILLYQNEFISFFDLFLPLYFYLISGIVGLLVAVIFKGCKKEMVLFSLILSCTISINTNVILYPIVLFVAMVIANFFRQKWNFHSLAFVRILLILALVVNSYSYLNIAEKLNAFNYDLFDVFLGYGVGALASTSIFCLIFAFFFLLLQRFYKKMIPIMASLSFCLFLLLFYFVTKDVYYLECLLQGSVYFSFIFLGADLYVSPSTKWGMMIYGMMIGVLTAFLALFLPIYEVGFFAILLASFTIPFLRRLEAKKYLH